MSFYARDFIFNGRMSQELGLTISSDGPESDTSAGSNVELITQKLYRRPKNYLLGVEQLADYSFPVQFNSETPINAVFAAKIEQLLFGQMGYKKLQVIQPDMDMYYWNCFLTNQQVSRVGGEIVGWKCDVMCDSPWGYSFPRTETYISASLPLVGNYITWNNRSGNNDYSYPKIEFQMSGAGGEFSLKNNSDATDIDGPRIFSFRDLSPNEVITVDNELKIITSSLGFNRLASSNKRFFRAVQGLNNMQVSGEAIYLKIIHTDAQKIGG